MLDGDVMSPSEMVEFLNELAVECKDEEIREKLVQCSIYIHAVSCKF